MPTTTFDTLGYAKKLEAAGFTRLQAEAQASALRELIEDRIAKAGFAWNGASP